MHDYLAWDAEHILSELGLTDRFSFLPFTTDPGPVYRALDIVVFPNQGAGLGRPVLEAAAYGIPVIASGSPDGAGILVPDRTGLLLQESSAEHLAAAMSVLVGDPERRRDLGRQAAEHAALHLGSDAAARSVEAVYAATRP